MKKMDNRGFTLIELLVTIILLSIIVGITGYSISKIIETSKEKDYQLFIKEIKNAVELHYQECKFINNNDNCGVSISLGSLVNNGFLKGNSTIKTGENKDKFTLVNPRDNVDVSGCYITYSYEDGKIIVSAFTTSNSCPTNEDYANN